ncbi:flippase-like domain-containing protein [Candidatus Woesearchaeota archaeon]|nr:flippase-like domain-containing protein [Candidatus Woesearchaeota archaeon]
MELNKLKKFCRNKTVKRIFSLLVIFFIIFFIVKDIFIPNYNELKNYSWNVNVWYLVLSFIIFLFMWFFKTFCWNMVLKKLDVNVPFIRLCKIKMYSLMMRYIPGKIWSFVKGSFMLKSKTNSFMKSFLIMVLDVFYDMYAALVLFLLAILILPEFKGQFNIYWLLLLLLSFCLIHPKVLTKIIGFSAKVCRKKVDFDFNISFVDSLKILFMYIISWFFTGLALYFLIKGIGPVSFNFIFALTGLFAISWSVGLISLITPSGLGVREGVFGFLLSFYFPLSVAMIISFLARIFLSLVELFLTIVLTIIDRKNN